MPSRGGGGPSAKQKARTRSLAYVLPDREDAHAGVKTGNRTEQWHSLQGTEVLLVDVPVCSQKDHKILPRLLFRFLPRGLGSCTEYENSQRRARLTRSGAVHSANHRPPVGAAVPAEWCRRAHEVGNVTLQTGTRPWQWPPVQRQCHGPSGRERGREEGGGGSRMRYRRCDWGAARCEREASVCACD